MLPFDFFFWFFFHDIFQFLSSIFSTILLYNKEAVSRTLCSLFVSASRVAARGADTALYNFVNSFLIQLVMFIICFLEKCLVISKTFIFWGGDFVSDSQKTDYLMPSTNFF